jgi:regulator of protease activity HflC (stomatin/prohibitin superfamily)
MIGFLVAAVVSFFAWFIIMPLILGFLRLIGFYTIVGEREAQVFLLFGKVLKVIDQPGLHLLWMELGPQAFLVNWLGERRVVDLRVDQRYLRSQPVNSEEGAPMGIGVWYEMYVSDPVAFLFKNADPQGSLAANVSNSTVRTLSNMPLDSMLQTRHEMSRAVRAEVSPKSHEWGYRLGSVYIRKVHFRDGNMIRQIEEKVGNRLRQVTSAIKQDGANQVNVISGDAEKKAATEFARAEAMRPKIIGDALSDITRDADVSRAMFEILEIQRLINSKARITLLPSGEGIAPLMAALPNAQGR